MKPPKNQNKIIYRMSKHSREFSEMNKIKEICAKVMIISPLIVDIEMIMTSSSIVTESDTK